MSSHPSQISLPGGRVDAADSLSKWSEQHGAVEEEGRRLVECALRESEEEVGGGWKEFDWRGVEVLGFSGPVPSLTKMPIYTTVTTTTHPNMSCSSVVAGFSATKNSSEVATVGLLRLSTVVANITRSLPISHHSNSPSRPQSGEKKAQTGREMAKKAAMAALGSVVTTPSYESDLGEVWGLTGLILRDFCTAVVQPWVEEEEEREREEREKEERRRRGEEGGS